MSTLGREGSCFLELEEMVDMFNLEVLVGSMLDDAKNLFEMLLTVFLLSL
jgi:hypothetical protein